jgi:antitoxin YefM
MPKAIALDQDIESVSELGAKAAAFVEKVRETGRPIVITQDGRSAAVLLDVREYASMLERLEVIEDILGGIKDIEEGRKMNTETARQKTLAALGASGK